MKGGDWVEPHFKHRRTSILTASERVNDPLRRGLPFSTKEYVMSDNEDATVTDDRLRLLIERIERLNEEKKGISDDIRDVYAEVKAVGYDAKIVRKMVKIRKQSRDDRLEEEMLTETYMAALGIE